MRMFTSQFQRDSGIPDRYRSAEWVACIASILYVAFAVPASAASLIWNLDGVQFEDGGIATGFIEFDADLFDPGACSPTCGGLIDWGISVSGGSLSMGVDPPFPPFTYNATTSLGEVFFNQPQFPGHVFNLKDLSTLGDPATPDRLLALYTDAPLTNSGGQLRLVRISQFVGSIECINCDPFRFITTGSLAAIPLPGGMVLFLSALAGLMRVRWRN